MGKPLSLPIFLVYHLLERLHKQVSQLLITCVVGVQSDIYRIGSEVILISIAVSKPVAHRQAQELANRPDRCHIVFEVVVIASSGVSLPPMFWENTRTISLARCNQYDFGVRVKSIDFIYHNSPGTIESAVPLPCPQMLTMSPALTANFVQTISLPVVGVGVHTLPMTAVW